MNKSMTMSKLHTKIIIDIIVNGQITVIPFVRFVFDKLLIMHYFHPYFSKLRVLK